MHRLECRTRVLDLLARQAADNDTAYLARVNRCIDMALKLIASKAPGALLPDEEYVVLYRDYTQADFGLQVTGDATDEYVLSFGALAGTLVPSVNGTWDGIYHIEVQDSAGTWHRRQCREFWKTGATYFCSLDRPLVSVANVAMDFRLHTPEFFTRDDVVRVVDGKLWDSARATMNTLPRDFARYVADEDFRGSSRGRPRYMYRTRHFQIDAPNRAPVAVLNTQVDINMSPTFPWVGPEPPGVLSYVITYGWGRRDQERNAPGGTLDPMWESSPSPESASVTVAAAVPRFVVDLTLPEIDWQVNFNVAGTTRATHSGLRKRIWRKRHSVLAGGGTFKDTIEAPGVFQLLAEVDGATTTYRDDGSVIPDYYRRMPESHGYYGWATAGHQDQRYELDLRVLRRPRALDNDYDAPQVHPDAESLLLFAVMHYVCLVDRKVDEAKLHMTAFRDELATFISNHANAAEILPSLPWAPEGVALANDPYWYGRFSVA